MRVFDLVDGVAADRGDLFLLRDQDKVEALEEAYEAQDAVS